MNFWLILKNPITDKFRACVNRSCSRWLNGTEIEGTEVEGNEWHVVPFGMFQTVESIQANAIWKPLNSIRQTRGCDPMARWWFSWLDDPPPFLVYFFWWPTAFSFTDDCSLRLTCCSPVVVVTLEFDEWIGFTESRESIMGTKRVGIEFRKFSNSEYAGICLSKCITNILLHCVLPNASSSSLLVTSEYYSMSTINE